MEEFRENALRQHFMSVKNIMSQAATFCRLETVRLRVCVKIEAGVHGHYARVHSPRTVAIYSESESFRHTHSSFICLSRYDIDVISADFYFLKL